MNKMTSRIEQPVSTIAFLWPVYGLGDWSQETVAVFFEYGDAVSFVNENLPTRNLYIGEPDYDRRIAKGAR